MSAVFWTVGALVLLAAVVVGIRRYRDLRSTRVITCPETGRSEAVVLDVRHVINESLHGRDGLWLASCTRWPERQDCDQPCRTQIAEAPDGCRLRAMLEEFYVGKTCATCGKTFEGGADTWVHEPGLLDSEGHVLGWSEFPPERLPEVLESDRPICWDCRMVESLYEKHPELVTERPPRW